VACEPESYLENTSTRCPIIGFCGQPMTLQDFEFAKCIDYANHAPEEQVFEDWLSSNVGQPMTLFLVEGFEERSTGILQKIAQAGMKVSSIILGRYVDNLPLNAKYRERFERLAGKVSEKPPRIMDNRNDGLWVEHALSLVDTPRILIDITGMSNRGLFGALDSATTAVTSGRDVFVGYSEANEYWPKLSDWQQLKQDLKGNTNKTISELVDSKPWLFGHEHHVELVTCHEGYDSPGHGRALIGFLPFKPARLAAILGLENYSEAIFVAGLPRLHENQWRMSALREMNLPLTGNWIVEEISTFSYLSAVKSIATLLFVKPGLLHAYNVHIAILGSKLQTVGCWIVSSIVRSITMITSIPTTYFPESFSDGIGASWVFKLLPPCK